MAEQRQGFRFRLPWQSAAPKPASAPRRQPPPPPPPPPPPQQQQPRVSAPQSEKPPTTTTTTTSNTNPAQKPPSKPPGSSQAQTSARNDRPPTNGSTHSQVNSKPASPSRGVPQRPSPSRVSNSSAKTPSPTRVTPPSPQPKPKSSESSKTNPTSPLSQPPAEASSSSSSSLSVMERKSPGAHPQSPKTSEKMQVKAEDIINPPSLVPSSATQIVPPEEPKPTMSVSPKPQRLEADITSVNVVNNSKNQSPKHMTTPKSLKEPLVSLAAPSEISQQATERPDSPLVRTEEPNPLSESDRNSEETVAERKEILRELAKVEASSSRAHTKTRPNVAAHEEEQKQAEDNEEVLVKEALAKPSSNGKQANPVNLNPRDKSRVIHSQHNPPKSTGEHGALHKDIVGDISKFAQKMANTQHSKFGAEDKPVTVLTLAGDNKGASMQLGSDALKREGKIHIRRGYKTNPDESKEATTDGEGSSQTPSSENGEEQAMETYINSNVQTVNNSIVFDSSITETNPGVKVVVSPEVEEPAKKPCKRSDSHETKKAEVNVTPAEKHTYQPMVRRRCLKGLMMESSESDPDNPDKPRRHGCRVACKEKGKDSQIDL